MIDKNIIAFKTTPAELNPVLDALDMLAELCCVSSDGSIPTVGGVYIYNSSGNVIMSVCAVGLISAHASCFQFAALVAFYVLQLIGCFSF